MLLASIRTPVMRRYVFCCLVWRW